MAQQTTNNLTAKTWTPLTDADITAITFQNTSQYDIWIKGSTDTTTPTNMIGALKYGPGMGESAATMANLFPGLTGADRVFAYCSEAASITVSHA